jgi:uncharacterized membrane-anchored protein YhcB (DUF1043 family)
MMWIIFGMGLTSGMVIGVLIDMIYMVAQARRHRLDERMASHVSDLVPRKIPLRRPF